MKVIVEPVVFTPLVDLLLQQDWGDYVEDEIEENITLLATALHLTQEDGSKEWLYGVALQTLPFSLTGEPFDRHKAKLYEAQWAQPGAIIEALGDGYRYMTYHDEIYVPRPVLMWLFERWTETLDVVPTYSPQDLYRTLQMGEAMVAAGFVHDSEETH